MIVLHKHLKDEYLFDLYINSKLSIRAICFEMVPYIENPSKRRCIKMCVEWISGRKTPQIVVDNGQYNIEKIPAESHCDFKSHKVCSFNQNQINERIIFFLEWCKRSVTPSLMWEHVLALLKGYTVIN